MSKLVQTPSLDDVGEKWITWNVTLQKIVYVVAVLVW